MNIFNPSKYQLAIRDWLLNGIGSLIVRAVPGSGKTATLRWLQQFITGKRVACVSFGAKIVKDLALACPQAYCKTYNALGSQPIRQRLHGRWIKLYDGKKVPNKSLCILWDMYPKDANGDRPKEYFLYSRIVVRLVELAKNVGIGVLVPDTVEQWQRLIVYHGLTLDSKAATEDRAIEIAQDVLATSNKWSLQGKIDFNDQMYLLALWGLELPKFDVVCVDEYQDTNAIQVWMLQQLGKLDGSTRYLLFGDEKQGIYGFRGADVAAMQKGIETFNCQSLPLSYNYRSSKAVVANANDIFPAIGMEAAENAPDGTVEHLDDYNETTFRSTDAILCRNVAPLVKLAYSFILKRIACHILGREIGEGITRLIERMGADTIEDLQVKLDDYRARETARHTERGRTGEAETVNDQCDCVALFISMLKESNRTIDALNASIVSLFEDKSGCVTLATIHKAKGLQWPRVFILDYGLIPSKYATQDWQLEQEQNLQWVANTRAQVDQYYIESDAWQSQICDASKDDGANGTLS